MKNFSCLFIILLSAGTGLYSQEVSWSSKTDEYYKIENNHIVRYTLPDHHREVIANDAALTPAGMKRPLEINSFSLSEDGKLLLLFTNSKTVWRYKTKGDFWVLNLQTTKLYQIGKERPSSSMMFAKFSPDSKKIAYVSESNLFVENVWGNQTKQLTKSGHRKLINGAFDWAYEEEFSCRDGFRWSSDSRQIAFWQTDASQTRDHFLINNTDSIYPRINPVEYPAAGQKPSRVKIGVVDVEGGKTVWMRIPEDKLFGNYVPRMEWHPAGTEVVVQWLNRKQNQSKVLFCAVKTGEVREMFCEKDSAWIDAAALWDNSYEYGGWDWLDKGQRFLWASEKDGWRHIYSVNSFNGDSILLTRGDYDVIELIKADAYSGYLYFLASPANATQRALYKVKLDGSSTSPELVSPSDQKGWHSYEISPSGKYAYHSFSNHKIPTVYEWVELPAHTSQSNYVTNAVAAATSRPDAVEFFTVKNAEGIEMDAWMVKPANWDATKKYPVVFFVYTEPAAQYVKDKYGVANNFLYNGNPAADGYVYIAVDNRGTPVPKGRKWRKSIYRKIGQINISDQASAATNIFRKFAFIDTSRVAVWGWSGGGTAVLHLMFRYPQIYKTGIAIAALVNAATYDNIYEERYMGTPAEAAEDYVKASPLTYVASLQGNLLYIHGTGDDNVHYNNAEMLLNALIAHNKQFQFMSYPNRTHSLSEGDGTFEHLSELYTRFLKTNCPPGPR